MKLLPSSPLLVAGLCLLAFAVHAEDARPVKSVQFKDGKTLAVREGSNPEVITNEVTMPGDIQVNTNGTFQVAKGRERRFVEGQELGADGNLTSPDGTVVPVGDHIVIKGGRLTIVRDGEPTRPTGEITLGDGSRVKPDGTMIGPDGRLRRMLDGQITKFSGAPIASTDTVTVKDGVVILQKDGGKVTLKRGQTIAMSDGSKVSSDGVVAHPDGTRTKVAEGEILKLPVLPAKR